MAYEFKPQNTIVPTHNGIELAYWKITRRAAQSDNETFWEAFLSGYTSKIARDQGLYPFKTVRILFHNADHPVNEPETEELLDENKPDTNDADQLDKHKYYVHITRLAILAHGKMEEERTSAEASCYFFFGAVEA